jgi:hypothetical protein
MKAVRFSSPSPSSGSRKPNVDGEAVRDLSTAEQGLVNDDAFLPRKPEPVWIRLRNSICPQPRRPLPKTPPCSPAIVPQRTQFRPYAQLSEELVAGANKCVADMTEDRVRQARFAKMDIPSKVRDLHVVAGPIFLKNMPYMAIATSPYDNDGYVSAEHFHRLDVAEMAIAQNKALVWVPSEGFAQLTLAIERLQSEYGQHRPRRRHGKDPVRAHDRDRLKNLRICVTTIGGPKIIDGQARYRISSLWLAADAPDITASFTAPQDFST